MHKCHDPEIPITLVDPGPDHGVSIQNDVVLITMMLTAPGSTLRMISRDIGDKLLGMPGIREPSVEIVWDPPWHHSMITSEGRKRLGLD